MVTLYPTFTSPREWGGNRVIRNSILLIDVILNVRLLEQENGRKVQKGKKEEERKSGKKKGEKRERRKKGGRERERRIRKPKVTKTAALISMAVSIC